MALERGRAGPSSCNPPGRKRSARQRGGCSSWEAPRGTESKPAPLTQNGPPTPKVGRGGPKSKISAIAPSICVHRIATHDLRRLLACNGFSGIVVENNAYAECLAAIFR